MPCGKIAEQGKFEHRSLESFDQQNQPQHNNRKPTHGGKQHHKEWSNHWDDKEQKASQFEHNREQDG